MLFGALRQVLVAGGNFAGRALDRHRRGLDAADNLGQLCGSGIGVIAHLCEHAAEFATHACGEVAGGDRLQQAGERLQVAIGGGHQGVEAVHHHAEVVLEALGVATCAEVAVSGGLRQMLDFVVHCAEVNFYLRHGVGKHSLFAGQLVHVFAEIADCVAAHDLCQAHHYGDMRGGKIIVVTDDCCVIARKRGLIHTVIQLALVMPAFHLQLSLRDLLQLHLHFAHAGKKTPGLIGAAAVYGNRQVAGSDGIGNVGSNAKPVDQAAPDQPTADQRNQYSDATTDDHRPAAADLGGIQRCATLDQ